MPAPTLLRCVWTCARMGAARCLAVNVADDGTGLGATAALGMGVSPMRERAAALGGSYIIDSGPTDRPSYRPCRWP